ncbi:MAG TPA: hypothetical protein VJJ79_00805 [Candidatus Nanoarchaeia archaeon]|nr:hypothetical protein [Candidatus Nanoarchaeia archaeon]
MPQPQKVLRSGNIEIAVWENERDTSEGGIVTYQSVSVRKTWRDAQNMLQEQKLSLQKYDIERLLVLLRKVQEYLLLEDEK